MSGTGKHAVTAFARFASGEHSVKRKRERTEYQLLPQWRKVGALVNGKLTRKTLIRARPERARLSRPWLRLPAGNADPARRLGVTATVAAVVTLTAIAVAVMAAQPASPRTGQPSPAAQVIVKANAVPAVSGPGAFAAGHGAASRLAAGHPGTRGQAAAVPLVLTAADYQDCPAAAAACVDLARHITWLQASGKIEFGPVQMEPGKPGSAHPTPRGTFQVAWKAGPNLMSNIYHEPMPWATFFAPGGIAFHGGSLTQWSHGCVHLTVANAHYYNEHLPVGAEVVVF